MAKKDDSSVDVGEVYSKSEEFIDSNKKTLTYGVIAIVVIFGAYMAYKNMYASPRASEAQELIWKAEYYMEIDSLDKAIMGDGSNFGFEYIADEYSGTPSADVANMYLGNIYMQKGEYQLAIEYYKKADLGGSVLPAQAIGNIGDAYVELGDIEQAISHFEQAAGMDENDFTAPMYLMKAGIAYESLGNYSKAADSYRRITEDHPNFERIEEAKKMLGRAETLAG